MLLWVVFACPACIFRLPKTNTFFSGRNLNSKQEAPKLPPVLSHRQLNRAAGLPQDPAAAGLFPFCIPPSTSQAQPCLPGGCYLTTLPGIVTAASFLPKGLHACPTCLQFSSLLLLAPFPLAHREAQRFRGPVPQ